MPTDAQLSRALRAAVDEKFAQNPDDVRPKAVRTIAEKSLGLDEGYFLETEGWKEQSKEILQDRFEQLIAGAEKSEHNKKKRKSSEPAEEDTSDGQPSKKRKSKGASPVNGKQGKAKTKGKKHATKAVSPDTGKTQASIEDQQGVDMEEEEPTPVPSKPDDEGLDDSDLSSLIDEPPKPTRKKKKKSSVEPAEVSTRSRPASKKTGESGLTAQEAELKELQSQLLQCGVRKIWAMHLKKFETYKEKVAELKRMLREIGLEGRFSKEKARQIKEERELRADIQAIQEGEQKWGMSDDGRRKRGIANRVVDFDDDEESD